MNYVLLHTYKQKTIKGLWFCVRKKKIKQNEKLRFLLIEKLNIKFVYGIYFFNN